MIIICKKDEKKINWMLCVCHCEFEGYIGWNKSLNILGHSPEKLKYVPLKLAQMEMFSLGKSEKIFQIKIFL